MVVGAASRDVAADDPRGWRLGGSSTYCSLAAARLGLRVGCLVGVDEAAGEASELALLEEAGVVLRRVPLAHGPVFENLEQGGHRRQRWSSESDGVPIVALPELWRGARAWLFVPVAGEVSDDWAGVPSAGALIGVGWQGLLREMASDGWVSRAAPAPSRLLQAAGLVSASVDDLPAGAELRDLGRLAPNATVVLTSGARGGLIRREGRVERYTALQSDGVVDPTGAGDVFLAALIVAWLLTGEAATAAGLRFAAAAASCSIEGAGLNGVPTRAQVATRLRSRSAAR